MTARPPLQVLIFRHPEDVEARPYEDAIVAAYQGGRNAGAYVVSGADLGVQLEIYEDKPLDSVLRQLDTFCHTLVIVLVDDKLLSAGTALWDWLESCFNHASSSNKRHAMLPFAMDEKSARSFAAKKGLSYCQAQLVQSLGEQAIRSAMAALRTLHEARILLAGGLPIRSGTPKPGHLTLFISHAKLDGLPLAKALMHDIEETNWLKSYYDAKDLPAGSNWREELESGVGTSLLIMLRTEVYEGRYWCQQEVLWADEHATPAVLVELRTALVAVMNLSSVFLPV